jgi:hypothetical protein
MKKNWGVPLLLLSILITTLGSVFKMTGAIALSEVLLWIGMIACVIAIGKILVGLFRPAN